MTDDVDSVTVTPGLIVIDDATIALTAALMVTLEVMVQPLTKFPEPQMLLSNDCASIPAMPNTTINNENKSNRKKDKTSFAPWWQRRVAGDDTGNSIRGRVRAQWTRWDWTFASECDMKFAMPLQCHWQCRRRAVLPRPGY